MSVHRKNACSLLIASPELCRIIRHLGSGIINASIITGAEIADVIWPHPFSRQKDATMQQTTVLIPAA
jgi:hypothetical protein